MSIDETSDASARLTPTKSVTLDLAARYPESFAYRMKNTFLGRPLVTEQLASERLGRAVALGVLILLVLRHGEETIWIAGDGGGVLAPAAAVAAALEQTAADHADVVRSEARVEARRGQPAATLTTYLRPYADGARVAADLEPRLRGRLAAITGVASGAVTVRPRVLAARQLKRHLP